MIECDDFSKPLTSFGANKKFIFGTEISLSLIDFVYIKKKEKSLEGNNLENFANVEENLLSESDFFFIKFKGKTKLEGMFV